MGTDAVPRIIYNHTLNRGTWLGGRGCYTPTNEVGRQIKEWVTFFFDYLTVFISKFSLNRQLGEKFLFFYLLKLKYRNKSANRWNLSWSFFFQLRHLTHLLFLRIFPSWTFFFMICIPKKKMDNLYISYTINLQLHVYKKENILLSW